MYTDIDMTEDASNTLLNNRNPLASIFDSKGEISEVKLNALIDNYANNTNRCRTLIDPFWEKCEKALLVTLVYYTFEEDEDYLKKGFSAPERDPYGNPIERNGRRNIKDLQGFQGGRCFNTVFELIHEAEEDDKSNEKNILLIRLDDFFIRHPKSQAKVYYDTFLIASKRTENIIFKTTPVELRYFFSDAFDDSKQSAEQKGMTANDDTMETVSSDTSDTEEFDFSHQIYFFADTKAEAKDIFDEIHSRFTSKLIAVRATKRSNYKVKIGANKDAVCDIACELSKKKKSIYVYEQNFLKSISEESSKYKKRLFRDIKYYFIRELDDKSKTYDELSTEISSGILFENPLIKDTYEALASLIPLKDMKAIALSVLNKLGSASKKNVESRE